MSRKYKIAALVIPLMLLGFLKEYLFTGMNAQLYNKFYDPDEKYKNIINPPFTLLDSLSYWNIYTIKWCITPVFIFLFWFLQKKLMTLLFTEKKAVRWLGFMYLSLLLLAGISFFTGWAVGYIEDGYRFSRIFVGLAESPVPCMVLIPLTYFYKNYNAEL
ncbi:MAG: hypothetical protein ACXVOH_07820 [Bacteroidia bacterium]